MKIEDLQPGIKIVFSKSPSAYINKGELCEVIATDKDRVVFRTKMIQMTLNFKALSECHFIYAKDFL